MSEKKLQDYLPFYIGCKIQRVTKSGEIDYVKLDAYEYYRINQETYPYIIKPILRRLDDITDEEIKELIGWDKLNEIYADVNFERGNFGIVINYSIEAGDQGLYKQSHNITFHSLSPKEWHYLLSKGFDLFYLIKNGLAIDSATLPKIN